eukprot:CAMPEP_0184496744 /NCGR_PEP_ID=MMETSP0113_2-20130426/34764_1 /TAXON_ID=91329 /ORGANISM="Norrisiella sphaerica, Strain BC52" /LENGTH=518 /DNA_ID=CAMNT_0026883519 /DNA_START=243 /DNA_END=1796 /DNA_ORIENTATION=-
MRVDVVDKALDITLGFTTQTNFQETWSKTPGATEHLLSLACARKNAGISLKASKVLVNLSEHEAIRTQIIKESGVKLCIAKLKDPLSRDQHWLYVSLLANLTTEKSACETLVQDNEGAGLNFFFQRYLASADDKTSETVFQYGGYVLTNLTQFEFGRKWLLDNTTDGNTDTDKDKGDADGNQQGDGAEVESKADADKATRDSKNDRKEAASTSVSGRYQCWCLPKYQRMNIRAGPSKDADPTGHFLFHGDLVDVTAEKDGWLKHQRGWTAREWGGKTILYPYYSHFLILISFTSSLNPIRRLATFQTIRNCAIDNKLLQHVKKSANDLIERLLLPLVIDRPYEDHEKKGMPSKVITKNNLLCKAAAVRGSVRAIPDTSNHDNNSALLEDAALKKAILETLVQFVRDEEMRRILDEKRTYVILRELHKYEEIAEVKELVEHVENFFILDKKCLQQPRPVGDGKTKVEHEVWTAPDAPLWKEPNVPAIKDGGDDDSITILHEKKAEDGVVKKVSTFEAKR